MQSPAAGSGSAPGRAWTASLRRASWADSRRRGLDRKTNKALLFQHIEESGSDGANLPELMQVLPSLSRDQVQKLVQELKSEGRVRLSGWGRSGRWYAGPGPDGDASDPR